MGLQESSNPIATPGFAGFVPSMSMKYGMTFGNATREILKTDPSLKKGLIQQEFAKRMLKEKALANVEAQNLPDDQKNVWERRNTYATGDDRFSFPPVPGYTGYIARSREHFGRPFVETTNASLLEFKRMLKSKNTLPPKVLAIQQKRLKKEEAAAGDLLPAATPVHITSFDPYAHPYQDETSPYKLPKNHPQKTFISGYTGFVPRLQNHFGVPYPDSVRRAIEDFVQAPPPANPYTIERKEKRLETPKIVTTKPIPGFTGHLPGSRTCYSMSFGKTAQSAYDQFNLRDESGKMPALQPSMPAKDLKKIKPIAGYRGFKSAYQTL